MADFIPVLNSTGTFEFKQPISDIVNTQTVFTCKSIRKIAELIASGVDVLIDYYTASGLSEETYLEDSKNDLSIIGLYSDSNNWLYVPSSQINAYPDASGVVYRRTAFAVNLGPIEESYNLTTLNDALSELIYTHLGITPIIRIVSLSEKAMIKRADHEAILRMRQGKINLRKTIYVELAEAKATIEKLTAQNKALEEHVIKSIV